MFKFTKAGGYQRLTGTCYFHLHFSLEDGGNLYLLDIGSIYHTTWCYVPEHQNLNSYYHDNLIQKKVCTFM
jgi:hypothetical protein